MKKQFQLDTEGLGIIFLPFRNYVPNENQAINTHCEWLANILYSNI